MIAALLDHIWQSTLFAGAAGLLTLAFRRNRAALRFWLWFAASLKFLVPFAVLAALGGYLARLFPASLPSSILAIQPAAEKFSVPARTLVAPHAQGIDLVLLMMVLWLAGFAAILASHMLRWLRLRAVTAQAQDIPVHAPVRIKASASLLEPGLVGILKPVVLLPAGLMARLSEPERDSILAHELSHLRRRDNVTAAIHMVVEALFWFYPLVWLIGARLITERERACDESVLAGGHDPEVYAGGILKVCKFCVQSPLACAAGASGADLGMRVRLIMTAETARGVGIGKRLLLGSTAAIALALPVMAGFFHTPMAVEMRRNVIAVQARAEQAVTAMVEQIGMAPTEHVTVKPLPRLKVIMAVAAPALPQLEPLLPAPQTVNALPPPPSVEQPSAAAAPVQVRAGVVKEALLALDPRGDGDPDAVTCRAPQALPGSRLPGPEICKVNRVWAELRAEGRDISPDGTMLVPTLSRGRLAMASKCYMGSALPVTLPSDTFPLARCR